MPRTLLMFGLSVLWIGQAHGKRAPEPTPVPTGWHTVEVGRKDAGWRGSCYYPPLWDELPRAERSMARQKALAAMVAQWRGQREVFVTFDSWTIDEVEATLLSRPEKIEAVATRSGEFCQQVMAAGAATASWGLWLEGLAGRLTAGECTTPLDYQLVQYLDIGRGWQEQVPFCKGNRAIVGATASDEYRLTSGGAWITGVGDVSDSTSTSSLPCDYEGCFRGQIIGRFVTDDGVASVFPIGLRLEFEAPEDGKFSFMINDDSFLDNAWRSQGAITDHTAITITPTE
ncbi:MAG: hypothetical protein ABIO70_28635 [Pseudomonadota bacterium]